jgi:hypothetical protein
LEDLRHDSRPRLASSSKKNELVVMFVGNRKQKKRNGFARKWKAFSRTGSTFQHNCNCDLCISFATRAILARLKPFLIYARPKYYPIVIGDYDALLPRHQHQHQQKPSHFNVFIMNGCLNASAGVILFSGLSAKQRSSRSLNNSSSLISASLRPFDADMRRVRRSRDGLLNARVLMVSCDSDKSVKVLF